MASPRVRCCGQERDEALARANAAEVPDCITNSSANCLTTFDCEFSAARARQRHNAACWVVLLVGMEGTRTTVARVAAVSAVSAAALGDQDTLTVQDVDDSPPDELMLNTST